MTNINGWQVQVSDCGKYLYVELDGAAGQIHIKADDDGFVVDLWSSDNPPDCVASACATYRELEPE